jgi:fimbrial isopeptide formation D2 family protein/LPXTG-motif cell wall-anchored protein
MNRKTIRLLTVFLVGVFMATMMLPVAVPGAPSKGNLMIHKYVMSDTSLAGTKGDGTEIAPGDLPTGAAPLKDITFNLYKVKLGTDGVYPTPGELKLDNYKNPTKLTDSADASFSVAPADLPSVKTDENGLAAAVNLDQGIYLVVEGESDRVTTPAAPFVVSVPMTNPAGDGWLTTVHVYPKNEMLSFTKTVNADAVQVGDLVTYTLTPAVPSGILNLSSYIIVDSLDPALDFVDISSIKAATTKAGLASGTTLIKGTHYATTPDDGTANGPKVYVLFSSVGRSLLDGNGFRYLEITLNTKVNKKILATSTVSNTAKIDFNNQFDERKIVWSTDINGNPETTIHTATIAITAQDGHSGAKLADAQFKIASSLENAKTGSFLKKDTDEKIYDVGDIGYEDAHDWVTITTSPTGKASFAGLKDYLVASDGTKTYLSYYLVETKAPSGYNLLSNPITVTFSAENSTVDNGYTVPVFVNHFRGLQLPRTGGTGTMLFTIGGIVLIGLATLVLINMKKKEEPITE